MGNIVIYPTDTAQWQALVSEAEVALNYLLGEDIESYLVFLLMRFTEKPEFVKSVLAVDFLESVHGMKHEKSQKLREVGDKSLLFSGLFPQIAQRRRVDLNYFIDVGQTAYSRLAYLVEVSTDLYAGLCHEFVHLTQLLHIMRDISLQRPILSLNEKNQRTLGLENNVFLIMNPEEKRH